MKKILLIGLLLPFLAVSCNNDDAALNSERGSLSLKIAFGETDVHNTRAAMTGYTLTLTGAENRTIENPESTITNLTPGDYTITLTNYSTPYTPKFSDPRYTGSTTATVIEGGNTTVELSLSQDNAGVYFDISEGLKELYPNLVPTVTQGAAALVYSGTNKEAKGYFNTGDVVITLDNNGQVMKLNGEDSRTLAIEGGKNWKVNLYVDGESGSISLNVTIDTDVTQENISWIVGNDPNAIPGANSYIVAPGETADIKVKRAFIAWKELYEWNIIGELSWKFIWADTPGGLGASSTIESVTMEGTGEDAVIKVKAGSTPGNAVIALVETIDDIDDIRWSWHVWVTDYDPNSGGTNTFGENTLMDRNLGALNKTKGDLKSRGLHYEWGRKDPFPPAPGHQVTGAGNDYVYSKVYGEDGSELVLGKKDISENVLVEGNGIVYLPAPRASELESIMFTLMNPNHYVHVPITVYAAVPPLPSTWTTNVWAFHYNDMLNGLWNAAPGKESMLESLVGFQIKDPYNGTDEMVADHDPERFRTGLKTIFDPCPEGWRVPNDVNMFDGMHTNNATPWAMGHGPELNGAYFPASAPIDCNEGLFANSNGYGGGIWLGPTGGYGGRTFEFIYSQTSNSFNIIIPGGSAEDPLYSHTQSGCFRAYGFNVRCAKE